MVDNCISRRIIPLFLLNFQILSVTRPRVPIFNAKQKKNKIKNASQDADSFGICLLQLFK